MEQLQDAVEGDNALVSDRAEQYGNTQKIYYEFLWISESYFLRGVMSFLDLTQIQSQRNLNDLPSVQTCIFNDILRLDFNKFKQNLVEFNNH